MLENASDEICTIWHSTSTGFPFVLRGRFALRSGWQILSRRARRYKRRRRKKSWRDDEAKSRSLTAVQQLAGFGMTDLRTKLGWARTEAASQAGGTRVEALLVLELLP